jgi:hypothetical protein
MALPVQPNTTCDIYRSGNAPPASPDVAGVVCLLKADYGLGLERGEGDSASKKYSHKMLVDCATDIRDAYDAGTIGANADTVYIPDKNGVAYKVVYVEIAAAGSAASHKRVFLSRKGPTWPSSNL